MIEKGDVKRCSKAFEELLNVYNERVVDLMDARIKEVDENVRLEM